MKIVLIIIFLLLVGAFCIISNGHIMLNSWSNVSYFFGLYLQWLSDVFSKTENITGNVARFFGI